MPITPSCPQSILMRERKMLLFWGLQSSRQVRGLREQAGSWLPPHTAVTLGSHRTPLGPLPSSFSAALLCHLTHGLFPCPLSKMLMSSATATWTCRAEHLCFHRNLWIRAGGMEQHSQQGFALVPNHPLHSPKFPLHSQIAPRQSSG